MCGKRAGFAVPRGQQDLSNEVSLFQIPFSLNIVRHSELFQILWTYILLKSRHG